MVEPVPICAKDATIWDRFSEFPGFALFFRDVSKFTANPVVSAQLQLRNCNYVLKGQPPRRCKWYHLNGHIASERKLAKYLIFGRDYPSIAEQSQRLAFTGVRSLDEGLKRYYEAPQWNRAYHFTCPILLSPVHARVYLGSRIVSICAAGHPVPEMTIRDRMDILARTRASGTRVVPKALILNFRYPRNYFHCLVDILSRLAWANQLGLPRDLPVIVPKITATRSFSAALLKSSLFDGREIIVQQDDEFIRCNESYYLLPPRHCRDIIETVANSFDAKSPKRVLGSKIALLREQHCVASRTTQGWQRLLADLDRDGFDIIDPATLTIGEQKHVFQNADVVVGENGAVFANLIFGDPSRLRIHAAIHDSYITPTFNLLASTIGVDYRAHILPSQQDRGVIVATLSDETRNELIACATAD